LYNRWYGESEFFFASCKVILLVGLMSVTFVTMIGGNPRNDAYGFRNWTEGEAMHPYYADGATGRFLGIWISIRYAVFTVGGPAFLALSAGEISNPRCTIPRVARLIVWRVCGLYIMGAVAVGIICPSRDPAYLEAVNNGEPGAGSSPWVFGIRKLGITTFLPDAINFMILLSGLSCGNTFLYTASRSLYSLAQSGQAPRIFLKCSKRGIPYVTGEWFLAF
jgi:amino acid transporter